MRKIGAWLGALAFLSASCGGAQPAGEDERSALAVIEAIARHDAVLARRLLRATTSDGNLDVSTAPTADGAWSVGVRGRAGTSLRFVPLGHRPSPRRLDVDRTVYNGVAPATDAVLVRDESVSELLYLLRDASAPTTFSFRVERGPDLVEVRDDGAAGLSFRDATGVERMYVGAPYALDMKGSRRDARLFMRGDVLEIALDATGLTFPVLLDPFVGAARFRRVVVEPPPRYAPALADRGGKLVLFGGHGSVPLGDTWTWENERWTELKPATSPPAREGSAFGAIGDKAFLFGGVDASLTRALDDTWSFDGATWRQLMPARKPPALVYSSFLRLGAKLVLVGGKNPKTDSTWTFDGSNWTELTTPRPPFPTRGGGVAAASDGVAAYCVFDTEGGASAQTWMFDGAKWTDLSSTASTPTRSTALAHIAGKLVLVVDWDGVYEWSGSSWVKSAFGWAPPRDIVGLRSYGAAAGTDVLHLFGGATLGGSRETFLRLDAKGWSRPRSLSKPPGRALGAFATAGDRALLFGGLGDELLGDTWHFDGKLWSELKPATAPAPRALSAAAGTSDGVLLFGGIDAKSGVNDTWTWDRTTWRRREPALNPPADLDAKLTRVGGSNVLLADGKTYVWDGAQWARHPGAMPTVRSFVTGEDWSALTTFNGQAFLVVPELGQQWRLDSMAFSAVPGVGTDALGGPKNVRPLLGDVAVDLGKHVVLLGHRVGATTTESFVWDGKGWAQLAVDGLPPLTRVMATRVGSEVFVFGGFDDEGRASAETYALRVAFDNGEPCDGPSDCETGFCAQGVCCNAACTNTAESCNLPPTRGTCAPIQAVCTSPTTLEGADRVVKQCAPYLCVAGACVQTCAATSDCAGGFVCDVASGRCSTPTAAAPDDSSCAVGGPGGDRNAPASALVPAVAVVASTAARRRRRSSVTTRWTARQ